MNRIRVLPENVANQIAAGEVVERPASVVKELVENALDAEARHVRVEIQAGGRSLIRVSDDGAGMSRDDALLCFERHATSKIRSAEDLQRVGTMGFRGEALPSIASVSRLVLTTREREGVSPEAVQVIIHGGKIVEVRSAAGPPGTSVEVRHLFYNLPARRKFLRSEETERAHIQHYLTLAAVAFPEVGFHFVNRQRTVWRLPPTELDPADAASRLAALRERLRGLYGSELRLIPTDYRARLRLPHLPDESLSGEGPFHEEDALRIWGFIGAPGVSRATRADQHIFVNRRPIEHRGLNRAILEGYHTALMKGRFPVCALFIECDPALVDVNVHPAKREVKFRLELQVRTAVTQAVRQALLRYAAGEGAEPARLASRGESGAASGEERGAAPAPPAESPAPTEQELKLPGDVLARLRPRREEIPRTPRSEAESRLPTAFPGTRSPEPISGPASSDEGRAEGRPEGSKLPASESAPLLQIPLRVLGVLGDLYVAMESDRGLVLMDQHAAHERVLFEQMMEQLESGPVPAQRLLLPETVELGPRDAAFLRRNLEALARLGVRLNEFGERTFLLDALPSFVSAPDPRRFVLDLLDELQRTGVRVNRFRLGEEAVAKTVCRHAVKAGDPLKPPEIERLVEQLRRCRMPYTCPHGRPTLIEFSYRELEKRFGRTG